MNIFDHQPARKKQKIKASSPDPISQNVQALHTGIGALMDKFGRSHTGEGLTENELVMGTLAQGSYKDSHAEKAAYLNEKGLDAWEVDRALSDDLATVYHNAEENRVVTAYRGTKVAADLVPDLQIVLGLEKTGERFQEGKERFAAIKEKYGDATHDLASHSLGGAINNAVFEKYKDDIREVHNFAPGAGASHLHDESQNDRVLGKGFGGFTFKGDTHKHRKRVHNYHVAGDPISALARFDHSATNKTLAPVKGNMNPHTIAQFSL